LHKQNQAASLPEFRFSILNKEYSTQEFAAYGAIAANSKMTFCSDRMQRMNSNTLTGVIGLLFLGPGLIMILIGAGVITVGPDSLNTPRWVVVFAGIPFAAIGLYILSQNIKALHWFKDYVALFIFTSFSVIADWIAFGSGEREFGSSASFLEGDAVGRIVFGLCGVFLTVVTIIGWYRMVKYWMTGKKSW
jgi:hypothetical protein